MNRFNHAAMPTPITDADRERMAAAVARGERLRAAAARRERACKILVNTLWVAISAAFIFTLWSMHA